MKKKLALIAAAIGLSGCALNPSFEKSALHYNRVIADTTNEQNFLNIIRASQHEPMYFGGFSQLSGELTYGLTSGLNASVVGQTIDTEGPADAIATTISRGADTFSPSLSANVVNNPSFDYQVLDTQEFYQGITRAIDEQTIINYLHQGWPAEILGALLIERVDFNLDSIDDKLDARKSKKKETTRKRNKTAITRIGYINNEPTPDEFGKNNVKLNFSTILRCLELRSVSHTARNVFDITLPKEKKGNDSKLGFSNLTLPSNVALTFDEENESYLLRQTPPDTIELFATSRDQDPNKISMCEKGLATKLTLLAHNLSDLYKKDHSKIRHTVDFTYLPGQETTLWKLAATDEQRNRLLMNNPEIKPGVTAGICDELQKIGQNQYCKKIDIDVAFRSIQGVLYFLGEYVRDDLHNAATSDPKKRVYTLRVNGSDLKIINVVDKKVDAARAITTTKLNGVNYSLCRSHYSEKNDNSIACSTSSNLQDRQHFNDLTLRFINQMINLQKSANERPTTSTVRIR